MRKRSRAHEAGSVEARSSISKSIFFANRVVRAVVGAFACTQSNQPRAPQERPKSGQEGPRVVPGGIPRRPRGPAGTIFRLRSTKETLFERGAPRDLVAKRLRNDFRPVVEACAQARDYEKHNKTNVFCRLSIGGVFFDKVSAVESQSLKNREK